MRYRLWRHKVSHHTKYEGCSPCGYWVMDIYVYLGSKVIKVTWYFVKKIVSHSYPYIPKIRTIALLLSPELGMCIINTGSGWSCDILSKNFAPIVFSMYHKHIEVDSQLEWNPIKLQNLISQGIVYQRFLRH